jgi:tryptophan synthase alpha chain
MKSRYAKRFEELKKAGEGAFIPFVTLGDPDEKESEKIIEMLVESGADALELGFAFSDPIADGKTIQAADERAINSGITPDKAFSIIKKVRKKNDSIPVGLLVYCNTVYNYGIGAFYEKAKEAGVDGILIADLSLEESKPYLSVAKKSGIEQIFIIAPTTPSERIEKIVSKAAGFIYLVSVTGITGARKTVSKSALGLIKRVRKKTGLPVCVGFGISRPEHAKKMLGAGADGVIVGSAIVSKIEKNLKNHEKMLQDIAYYVSEMKNASRGLK